MLREFMMTTKRKRVLLLLPTRTYRATDFLAAAEAVGHRGRDWF